MLTQVLGSEHSSVMMLMVILAGLLKEKKKTNPDMKYIN